MEEMDGMKGELRHAACIVRLRNECECPSLFPSLPSPLPLATSIYHPFPYFLPLHLSPHMDGKGKGIILAQFQTSESRGKDTFMSEKRDGEENCKKKNR